MALLALSLELEEALISELVKQGHRLTGALSESIEVKLFQSFDALGLIGKFNDYGLFLDTGVKADRIPFGGTTGAGGRSKYITGLINWARIKFQVSLKQARGIAFAVARTHKIKGMPSRGEAFTGWMTKTLDRKERRIGEVIGEAAERDINILINNLVRNSQKIITG